MAEVSMLKSIRFVIILLVELSHNEVLQLGCLGVFSYNLATLLNNLINLKDLFKSEIFQN